MTTSEANELLTRRLDDLERRYVRLQRGAAAAALVAVSLLVMGQAKAKGRVVEGEAFALRDGKGAARGGLRVTESGAAELTLFSGRGQAAVMITADPSGKEIVGLMNEKAIPQATLALDLAAGKPFMSLFDATGTARAAVTLHSNGLPGVFLSDPNGNTTTLATFPSGEVGLVLAGKDKEARVVVAMGATGSPSLKLLKDHKALFEKP
jgi:hypothetical protein